MAFVNQRPIVKITAFGYTNEPTGTPTAGVVSGHTVHTAKVKNHGGTRASATLSGTLAATTDASAGSLTCVGGNSTSITGTVAPGAELTFTLDCTYSGLNDGAKVTADLNTSYTTNGLTREASGSPRPGLLHRPSRLSSHTHPRDRLEARNSNRTPPSAANATSTARARNTTRAPRTASRPTDRHAEADREPESHGVRGSRRRPSARRGNACVTLTDVSSSPQRVRESLVGIPEPARL